MISVYYNQKYGFLIVPNAIERFMGCYISIEPTIEIMAEETIDKIGCAIRKGIKIAETIFGNKQNIKVFQHFPRIIKELI